MSIFPVIARRFGPLLILSLLVCGANASATSDIPAIVANNNRVPAGRLENGVLTIRIEAAMGNWYPEENDGPAFQSAAFREAGGKLSTPGPFIRVPEGTSIHASIRNLLDQPLTIHGLHSRPNNGQEVLLIAPGETRDVVFQAGAPGTYLYWATRTGANGLLHRHADDDQLNGAFLVDPKGHAVDTNEERTLVISQYLVVYDEQSKPPKFYDILGFNGLSWPHSERLTYRVGQTVHWRVINATRVVHPMHLHGFYFRVDSVGDGETDTIYKGDERRMAVTELLRPGHTFSLTWTPERAGNWVFHCHVLRHISPENRYWQPGANEHQHDSADHARQGMAGLVMGIIVLPSETPVSQTSKTATPTRKLDLVASELPGIFGSNPGMAFSIPTTAGAKPTIPGPPLVLTQGQRSEIRVVNHLSEPLAVHWHGIELESYYDGVPGVSGSGTRLMPSIPPGESFVAQFTPPRAGTFIYHTHIDDLKQLSSGLYGPLIVLPPGEKFDAETDRVLVLSKAGPGDTPVWLNGSESPNLGQFRVGHIYRLRIINILPDNPPLEVRLEAAGVPVNWRPVAKDGADLPLGHRALCAAKQTVSIGETYDFEFRPEADGQLTLYATRPASVFPPEVTPSHRPVELRPATTIRANVAVTE
jgi:FtsP/CotA-like multicopper oxidase with cupredoxin domain